MTKFENSWGIHMREGLAENSLSRFYTSLRKGDNLLQHNSFDLPSHSHPNTTHSVSHTRPRPPCGSLSLHNLPCELTHPYPVSLLIFSQTLSHMYTPTILKFSHYLPTCLWRWSRQSVPKRRHIKFRRGGITQKKTYNIQNTVKVWNLDTNK